MKFMNRRPGARTPAPNIDCVTLDAPTRMLRVLYPATQPRASHRLDVPGGHRLHIDEFGAAEGLPALVLHGGPGSGCSPLLGRFFDPLRYRLICVDQRGAGRSEPAGRIQHNTTADLLADLRRVRQHFGIDRWLVVGGSWGATLAVAHAADAPDAVAGLLLRSAFLARRCDIDGFFQGHRSPSLGAWEQFAGAAPAADRADMLGHLACALASSDETTANAAALTWWRWEQAMAGNGVPDAPELAAAEPAGAALLALVQRYRVQAHYLRQRCWLAEPSLLDRCAAVPAVPTLLLHGTADRVCPPDGALALHAALPHSRLEWVEGAGHDPTHPGMTLAMLRSLDRLAEALGA